MERIPQSLMKKTKNSFRSLKRVAEILNQFKRKVPDADFIQAFSVKESELRKEMQDTGIASQKQFDERFEQFLKAVKANSFDIVKPIKNSLDEFREYYQISEELSEEQDVEPAEPINSQPKKRKTKTIKKEKTKIKKDTKVEDKIFQESGDEHENFLVN